jgi:hypothetical protein
MGWAGGSTPFSPSWDVVKFETIELVLQPADLLAICGHLRAEAARLFCDLINDKSRVAPDLKSSDAYSMAMHRLLMSTSYSATLFEVGK